MWLNIDESAPTTATLSDAEIIRAVTKIIEPVQSDEEDSSMAPAEAMIPSTREAAAALELALSWMETQQISSVKIMQVKTGYLYSGTVSLTATGGCLLFCFALPVRSA